MEDFQNVFFKDIFGATGIKSASSFPNTFFNLDYMLQDNFLCILHENFIDALYSYKHGPFIIIR
jgi:hypothetical protein